MGTLPYRADDGGPAVIAAEFRGGVEISTEPLVSVIIPTYQGAHVVGGAVRSALAQTHANLEVLVVDDGSTDATAQTLAGIRDPRLRVFVQANAGTAAARNRAFREARGAYVAFLDSDDRWLPEKIATELAVLRSAPDPVGIAYSSIYPVDDRGRLLNLGPIRTLAGNALDALLDGECYFMPSVCLFDRRVIENVGGFNAARYHEDYEFMLRAAGAYPIYPTARRLTVYRQSTTGKCRAILADYDRALAEELLLTDDLRGVLEADQIERLRRNVVRSLYARFLMYGFERHAARLVPLVDLPSLRTSTKGRLALLFAKTGINLVAPARRVVQAYYRLFRQGWWRRTTRNAGLRLDYD
jgi:glycosyltransferase involved in cell wall biosynthesis